MIACPYQDLFLYINDAIHEKWYTEWNEKNDKLEEIKIDSRPWKVNNRCGNDQTVINSLTAGHTLLTHVYLKKVYPCLNVNCANPY